MKTRIVSVILALMLLIAITNIATVARAATSTATVGFTDGDIEFGSFDAAQLDFDFGSHSLPLGAATYAAEDSTDRILTVLDAKSGEQDWSVTAALSEFTSGTVSNTFDGTITLTSGTANDAKLTVGATIVLTSQLGASNVVSADSTGLGTYTVTWDPSDVTLSLDSTNAATIVEPANYEGTITWSLVLI